MTTFLHKLVLDFAQVSVEKMVFAYLCYGLVDLELLWVMVLVQLKLQSQI